MSSPGKNSGSNNFNNIKLVLFAVLIVIICTGINWALISGLAASKSSYQSEINSIVNTIGHMKDAETNLNNFASNQNSLIDGNTERINDEDTKVDKLQDDLNTVQTQTNTLTVQATQLSNQLNSVNQTVNNQGNSIGTLNTNVANVTTSVNSINNSVGNLTTSVNGINNSVGTLTTSVNTLTTSVNNLVGGLQLTPTVSSNSTSGGTGYITLALNSSIAQTVAFRIEFIPPASSSGLATGTTMDGILQALYNAPPVELFEDSISGTAVRGDYTVFWSNSEYQVGEIIFVTQPTSLSAGAQSKSIYFEYNPTAVSYNVLITPVYESTITSTGAGVNTW
jgi:uncharacterized protein YoxC